MPISEEVISMGEDDFGSPVFTHTSISHSDEMKETPSRKSHKQVHVTLDMNLFDPAALREEVALETALSTLDGYLRNPAADRERLLSDLMQSPNLLEFVFAGIDETAAIILMDWLLEVFPITAGNFESSLGSNLLFRFSQFFWSLRYPCPDLQDCHHAVELALPVLKALSSLAFPGIGDQEDANDVDILGGVVKKSQRQKKKAKRHNRMSPIDPKPFDRLGIDVPGSNEDAQELIIELLHDQKQILQHYLQVLRGPAMQELVVKSYIPDNVPEPETPAYNGNDTGEVSMTVSTQVADQTPAAYPMVQPMKAALYFDTVDGFGAWRILISTRADRNLREARKKDPALFKIIVKKIKELSRGHFSDDNQKRLTGADNDIPIFEAKMTRDSRLVYQVDCVKEFDSEVEWQVLRIFGIYTHAQLERRFWEAVGCQLAGKGKEYRKRCVFRNPPHHPGDKVVSPASFPPIMESSSSPKSLQIPGLNNEDREELHALLVLEKFITFSQALLNSILADQDVAHVFHMSPQEQEIVKHDRSCYVLGRSGTGKTTTMLFKMLGIERTWDKLRDSLHDTIPRPRQLFVTQSRVLAEKVEEYYAKLSQSLAADQRTVEESKKLAKAKQTSTDQGLVDRDEEERHQGVLPRSFKELQDEHFPLFLTFDQLCRLLEADFGRSADGKAILEDEDVANEVTSNDYMLQQRDAFVSYSTFSKTYWPHFPQNLTKYLDPALVFAEFMSIIKGSEQTLTSDKPYLDRDGYTNLSHRSQGTFSAQRDTVYSLFQAYLRQKRTRREYDAADRTHTILRGLREEGIPGKQVDFIYVDEAQDNLLIDAFVLRSICNNPNGLFWAGDTAQTISAGSAFRFNDLKAFLYRVEEARKGAHDLQEQPRSFQLTINYRSHGGIVGCAHSVVQLITEFWPHSIDILAEEKGIIDGLRPVFFSGWDQDSVRYEQFLFGSSGSQIEFGAQQCILVRDESAREKLRSQVGDIGLILTLYESKGLEFNDVLLFNFFEDSTVDLSQWRVLLNALPQDKHITCPRFDETRHSGVCRELKFLYVAITRARKNLWIADCSEKGEPMRAIWNAKDQIQNCTPGDDVPRLAMSSTAEEWAKTARTLFDNKRYMQAIHCYERALLPRERDVAYAYYLREQARSTRMAQRGFGDPRSAAFVKAANAFLESALAATVERLSYYRIAAECFAESGDDCRAAEVYLSASEFTRAAKHYRKAGMFDEAVEVVQTHSNSIRQADADSIITVAKLFYFREGKLEKATNLFSELEDALEFMEDYEFNVARADLLEKIGRLADAAELHLSEGNVKKAIDLFLQDNQNSVSFKRAEQCLLNELWRLLSFGVTVGPGSEEMRLHLKALIELSASFSDCSSYTLDQITMFRIILSNPEDSSLLQQLGEKFHTEHGDPISSLLCLDHAFSRSYRIQVESCIKVAVVLQAFLLYAKELQKISVEPNPCLNPDIQRLFGFQISTDSVATIPVGTWLHRRLYQHRAVILSDEERICIRASDLSGALRYSVCQHLKFRVQEENDACIKSQAFFPCVVLAVFGECINSNCPDGHVDANINETDSEWYHSRLRIIFQQILICQTVSTIESQDVHAKQCRFWLKQLYRAYYPPHHKLGALTSVDHSLIPEAEKGLLIAKGWIRDLFYILSSHNSFSIFPTLLTTITEAATLAFIFDKSAAQEYILRAPFFSQNHPKELLRQENRFIVSDLIESLEGSTPHTISTGVLFLQHVCDKRLPIDIGALCHLIDYLCQCLIQADRLQKYTTLHDTTLPHDWILSLSGEDSIRQRNTRVVGLLLNPMAGLLEELYTGSTQDFLFHVNRRISETPYRVRHIFIARICRALSLLGYNIANLRIRSDIVTNLSSLYRDGRMFPRLYIQFVQAKSWQNIVWALRNFEQDNKSSFDELIQLKEEAKVNGPVRPIRGTRTVVFRMHEEIPAVLNGNSPKEHVLRAEAEPFIPNHLANFNAELSQRSNNMPGEDEDVDETSAEEDDRAPFDYSDDLVTAAESVDADRVYQAPVVATAEQVAAATVLQTAYRRLIVRRRPPKNGLVDARLRWFLACCGVSEDFSPKYKVIVRGILPHALVCLEKANTYTYTAKQKAQKRIKVDTHERLEEAYTQLNQAMSMFKEILGLQKLLTPSSPFHREQSIGKLRSYITAVEQVMFNLPPGATKEWECDLKIAVEGIAMKPRRPPVKKPKPELIVEDDLI